MTVELDFTNILIYLCVIFLLGPAIFLFTRNGIDSKEMRRKALIIYPISVSLIIVILTLIFGMKETAYYFSEAGSGFIRGLIILIVFAFICLLFVLILIFLFSNQKTQILRSIKDFFNNN